jgi:eukaryotic-like serine/threonine-protein kinase
LLLALTPGTRLGVYEINAQIGEGGMGQVYRATDTRLKRQVAIKILSPTLALDADRLARFQREAEVLASLNHPNIGGIHGLEEANGVTAIVLELVEGEDLAQRIARGAVPVDDALLIARQIAEAVAAAHEQGIIHRDLKPANVKLRDDGMVKVLDFGLAKALQPAGVSPGVSPSPTITTPAMTQAGVILGTAAYMAPEQAKGKPADKRSDVWGFGCVLYEMLAGKRAFHGEDVSDTLAAILRGEPDWTALSADVPPPIRTLLMGCLAKDRRHRVADLSAALFVISYHSQLASPQQPAAPARRVPLWRKAMPVAAAATVAVAAGYAGWLLKPAAPRAVTRLTVPLGEGDAFTLAASAPLALSPDGTRLAYTANERLYLRALDRLDAAPIAGVEARGLASARSPFFSPDGRWLGFWESGQLKKVSVSAGAPVTLCALQAPPYGTTWAADNTILIGSGPEGIWRVPGDGGNPERIITVEAGQRAYGPQLLPDGRTVLFTLARTASWDDAQIVVQSLDNGTRQTLFTGGTDGRYVPTGHVVYSLRGSVLAVPFDARSLSIKGAPVPLVDGVWRSQSALSPAAHFAVSSDGTLAYVPPPSGPVALRRLAWVDRQGREEAIPVQPQVYRSPRIAPDGTRLAVEIEDSRQNRDIWVLEDFQRGTWTRITSDPADDFEPAWTPDGQHVIFSSLRAGSIALFRQAANGTGIAERVADLNRQNSAMPAVSPDGRYVVVRGPGGETADLMILDLDSARAGGLPTSGVGPPRPLIQMPFEEYNAAFSDDGRWLAYQSDTSGRFEVYVRPFPDVTTSQSLVSTAGGTEPVWARDGGEIFYRSPKGAVMRVPISAGASWKAGTPTQLFESPSYVFDGRGQRSYDVAPDGKRFVMLKNTDTSGPRTTPPRIVVVQNWFEELKRLVPAK